MRYIMNLLARLTAFPYDTDKSLKYEFRRRSLIDIESTLYDMDALQLVQLMNACIESIQRPYCDNASLINAIEWFAPYDAFDTALPPTPPLPSPSLSPTKTDTIDITQDEIMNKSHTTLNNQTKIFKPLKKVQSMHEIKRVNINQVFLIKTNLN